MRLFMERRACKLANIANSFISTTFASNHPRKGSMLNRYHSSKHHFSMQYRGVISLYYYGIITNISASIFNYYGSIQQDT